MKDPNLTDSVCLIYANKALQYATLHHQDTKISSILKYKTSLFAKLRLHDSAIYTSKNLLIQAIKINDSVAISGAYLRVGYYYDANYQKDSAYYFYKLSNEISLALKDSVKIGHGLVRTAIIQSDLGDYQGSDNTAVKALKYLQKDDYPYLSSIYNCIAISSKKQEDYKESIYWYDKAIGISKSKLNTLRYLNHKANAYRYLQEYDKSIEIFKELVQDSLLKNNPKTKAKIIDNLAFTKWLAKKNEKVLPELEKALQIRLAENDLYGLIASYAHLSTYFEAVNPKLGLSYASKMYDVANSQKSPQDQLEALQKLLVLDNASESKKHYTSYIQISDSLKMAEKEVQNKYAKIKYDSEINREDNLQLKIVGVHKDLALQKEKTTNLFLFTSGSFIFAGLLFFIYYKKQKHVLEKRAEVYNTETRIAKKIHDEVANDVVNIMNKIQYTDQTSDKILDDLEHVYMLTRDISHENNEIATGANFELQLKSMLANFNSTGVKIIIKDIHKVEFSLTTKEKQIEVYRILQELMVNMHKHSKATLVVLSFKMDKKMCFINYSDNGIGIDTETLILKNGLQNVENRINAIHGTITFESRLDKGFKVLLSFKR
ncbi:MAG: hypothetical protein IZT56_11110 [Bacteroidetes bacterium]|nr:hypothetical protein [Bacteroidota bacterium]